MVSPLEVAWSGIAGLCGGIVYLIVKQHVSPRAAVTVCTVSALFGIFAGDLVGEYFHVTKAGAGFFCGIAAMKVSVMIVDGSGLALVKLWLKRGLS